MSSRASSDEQPSPPASATESALPPRPVLLVAAGLAIVLVAGVAVVGLVFGGRQTPARQAGPLPVPAVSAPDAGRPECARLMAELPPTVKSAGRQLPRRELADPAPPATAAWGTSEPVVLRCGVGKPRELKPTSKLVVVDDVQWFPVDNTGATTWYVAGKPVTVAVTVPEGAGTGVVQDLSKAVAAAMPR
ncbi:MULTISPECIES: DUF3515 domain-containing protein [Thermocrispum]|uniref:DUF3515 domain-containing protein n=1 Tax=Thermocrispum agreste TaxID=37925 RepID=A0A2W4LT20_9PSEU|nr:MULTISPECIES: DUF3515 domain-containing protein [Thermocrispum]PZN00814.1 MAG: DUF3515 domain-containing protein [Thermocrispum agreste]